MLNYQVKDTNLLLVRNHRVNSYKECDGDFKQLFDDLKKGTYEGIKDQNYIRVETMTANEFSEWISYTEGIDSFNEVYDVFFATTVAEGGAPIMDDNLIVCTKHKTNAANKEISQVLQDIKSKQT